MGGGGRRFMSMMLIRSRLCFDRGVCCAAVS